MGNIVKVRFDKFPKPRNPMARELENPLFRSQRIPISSQIRAPKFDERALEDDLDDCPHDT